MTGIGINTAAKNYSYYMSRYTTSGPNRSRYIEIEGGEWYASINGGQDNNSTTVDTEHDLFVFRMRGGKVRGCVYGAAEQTNSSGNRVMVFTGGQVGGWICGASNGTSTSGGVLYGKTFVYFGGNAECNTKYQERTPAAIRNSLGGYVYASGCGSSPDRHVGEVTQGTNIVMADNAKVQYGVIGGGPCIYNAEPIADFFDIFYIGEGETMYRALFDLYEESKEKGLTRKEFLVEAAKLQGIYVPCLYDVKYNEDNTIKSMNPIVEGIPATVKKEVVKELDDVFFPTKPIVPFIRATQDRIVLEVQRGCIRGCRFCQAGQIYKPIRTRSVDKLMEYAAELVKSTGYDEMSLSSLSTSDYPDLEELLNKLIDLCAEKKMNISLPSLRIDAFSLDVMSKVQDVRKTSLTFAPEAGSQRMRNVINKGLTKDNILSGATMAFQGGWNKVKLYFMLGLPFETDEDIKEIMYLCNDIAAAYYEAVPKEKRMGRVQVSASTSFFIPKPFTAFQWAPMNNMQQFIDKAELTKKTMLEQLNKKSISYKWHEAGTSVVEGVFARGDRRISDAIYYAYKNGCLFDAWTEEYKHDVWMEAFEKYGAGLDFYIFRERNVDEILPWDILDIGVNKSYLVREWENARNEKVTENCKDKCAGCGAFTYKCGICPR